MPIPSDFENECLYSKDAWFIHDVLEMDVEKRRVVALVDTTKLGFLVDSQVALPGHPKHFPGAVAVQLTGTLASLLGAYVLDMRASDGWIGYGTHIHSAKFASLGKIGPPVQAACDVLKMRVIRGTTFIRYRYHYTQEGRNLYQAEHSAAWLQADPAL